MSQLSDYELKCLQKLVESIQDGKWSNTGLVQLIELSGAFLNMKTIPDYCNKFGLSYNGAKKCRTVKEIFGVKFIIDNE